MMRFLTTTFARGLRVAAVAGSLITGVARGNPASQSSEGRAGIESVPDQELLSGLGREAEVRHGLEDRWREMALNLGSGPVLWALRAPLEVETGDKGTVVRVVRQDPSGNLTFDGAVHRLLDSCIQRGLELTRPGKPIRVRVTLRGDAMLPYFAVTSTPAVYSTELGQAPAPQRIALGARLLLMSAKDSGAQIRQQRRSLWLNDWADSLRADLTAPRLLGSTDAAATEAATLMDAPRRLISGTAATGFARDALERDLYNLLPAHWFPQGSPPLRAQNIDDIPAVLEDMEARSSCGKRGHDSCEPYRGAVARAALYLADTYQLEATGKTLRILREGAVSQLPMDEERKLASKIGAIQAFSNPWVEEKRDLLIIPLNGEQERTDVYINEICSLAAHDLELARRFRSVFVGNNLTKDIDAVHRGIDELQKRFLEGRNQEAHRSVGDVALRIDDKEVALKQQLRKSSSTFVGGYRLPGTVLFVQWVDLGAAGSGLSFSALPDDAQADDPPRAGFIPFAGSTIEAVARAVLRGAVPTNNARLYNSHVGVSMSRLSSCASGLNCVIRGAPALVTVEAKDSPWLSAKDLTIDPPEQWIISSDTAADARPWVRLAQEEGGTPQRTVVKAVFRKSGHYVFGFKARPSVAQNFDHAEQTTFDVEVDPSDQVVSVPPDNGSLSRVWVARAPRVVHLNMASVLPLFPIPWTAMWDAPEQTALSGAISRYHLLPAADLAAVKTDFIEKMKLFLSCRKPEPGVPDSHDLVERLVRRKDVQNQVLLKMFDGRRESNAYEQTCSEIIDAVENEAKGKPWEAKLAQRTTALFNECSVVMEWLAAFGAVASYERDDACRSELNDRRTRWLAVSEALLEDERLDELLHPPPEADGVAGWCEQLAGGISARVDEQQSLRSEDTLRNAWYRACVTFAKSTWRRAWAASKELPTTLRVSLPHPDLVANVAALAEGGEHVVTREQLAVTNDGFARSLLAAPLWLLFGPAIQAFPPRHSTERIDIKHLDGAGRPVAEQSIDVRTRANAALWVRNSWGAVERADQRGWAASGRVTGGVPMLWEILTPTVGVILPIERKSELEVGGELGFGCALSQSHPTVRFWDTVCHGLVPHFQSRYSVETERLFFGGSLDYELATLRVIDVQIGASSGYYFPSSDTRGSTLIEGSIGFVH